MKSIIVLAFGGLTLTAERAFAQIPPGFELVRITDDPDHDVNARINECGQIVFVKTINQDGDLQEIFLYDNGRTTRITWNNVLDGLPDINDDGMITWTTQYSSTDARIWLYANGVATELFPGRSSEINNLGEIAFIRYGAPSCRGPEMDIFFYDGEEVSQITDAGGDAHQAVQINDEGELAWIRYDFCPQVWESDVMLYQDGRIIELTTDRIEPQRVDINDMGTVVWEAKDPDRGYRRFIEVWEDGEATVFLRDHGAPKLNNTGGLAISPGDGTRYSKVYYEGEIYTIQFGGAEYTGMQHINDHGEVPVFLNYGYPESDLAFLRRIRTGDSEFDGDIDHDDLAKLVDCMTGPMWVQRTNPGPEDSLCECRFLDINHDGSVDLRDYAIFQQNFGGE